MSDASIIVSSRMARAVSARLGDFKQQFVTSRRSPFNGTIKGVAAVYNRFGYFDERRAALDTWGRYVEALVYPERAQTNVVEMRAR
jgi:hypothetical protein